MDKKRQSGFTKTLALVILIAVIIVGLAAYSFVSQFMRPSDATDSLVADDDSNAGATKYLTIKEWGVKFALTADTANAYYDTRTLSTHDSMSLRSHSLDTEPVCTTTPQSIATIFRVPKNEEDESLPGKKYNQTQDGKTIGDYFYFIQSAQTSCTNNGDMQIILQGVRNGFVTAGPTIQADPMGY